MTHRSLLIWHRCGRLRGLREEWLVAKGNPPFNFVAFVLDYTPTPSQCKSGKAECSCNQTCFHVYFVAISAWPGGRVSKDGRDCACRLACVCSDELLLTSETMSVSQHLLWQLPAVSRLLSTTGPPPPNIFCSMVPIFKENNKWDSSCRCLTNVAFGVNMCLLLQTVT